MVWLLSSCVISMFLWFQTFICNIRTWWQEMTALKDHIIKPYHITPSPCHHISMHLMYNASYIFLNHVHNHPTQIHIQLKYFASCTPEPTNQIHVINKWSRRYMSSNLTESAYMSSHPTPHQIPIHGSTPQLQSSPCMHWCCLHWPWMRYQTPATLWSWQSLAHSYH